MNAERLLHHFDRMADAPDAVAHLRHFILDLAVRGKLVPQDPNDEPASELLKGIQSERQRQLKNGNFKKLEQFDSVSPKEIPFKIPLGWKVVRMGWLAAKLGAGSTPLGGKSIYQDNGVPFLRSQNVYNNGLRLDDVAYISRAIHEKMSGTHIQTHDILLNITGASIGRCALVPNDFVEGNVSQHVAIIRLFEPSIREFVHLSLTSPLYQNLIDEVEVGVSREGLSMQRLRLFPMLIAPLAEQQRIVAKVDELMALCDQLEAAQAEREGWRDKLVSASLARLNQPTEDPDAFREHARFYFNHLPRLTTRAEHIKQLRQTILNLAVRGKLVPQAHEHWESGKLGDFVAFQNGYAFKSEWFKKTGVRLCRNVNVGHGHIDWTNTARISEELAEDFCDFALSIGDIVLSLDRPLISTGLKVAIIRECDLPSLLLQRVAKPIFNQEKLLADFLLLWFTSTAFTDSIDPGRSNGVPHISTKQLAAINFALPPLAEQHRIIAKVGALILLCDQLEAQVDATRADSQRLREAVLHEALAG